MPTNTIKTQTPEDFLANVKELGFDLSNVEVLTADDVAEANKPKVQINNDGQEPKPSSFKL